MRDTTTGSRVKNILLSPSFLVLPQMANLTREIWTEIKLAQIWLLVLKESTRTECNVLVLRAHQ